MKNDLLLYFSVEVRRVVHQVARCLGGNLIGRADSLYHVHAAMPKSALTRQVNLVDNDLQRLAHLLRRVNKTYAAEVKW